MSNTSRPLLVELKRKVRAKRIPAEFRADELECGPPGREIWASVTEGGVNYWLASKRPLFRSKQGRTKSVRINAAGWYEAMFSPDEVDEALES